ncbi:hypothetical protein [Bradyrhizobium sp. JR3.5]
MERKYLEDAELHSAHAINSKTPLACEYAKCKNRLAGFLVMPSLSQHQDNSQAESFAKKARYV